MPPLRHVSNILFRTRSPLSHPPSPASCTSTLLLRPFPRRNRQFSLCTRSILPATSCASIPTRPNLYSKVLSPPSQATTILIVASSPSPSTYASDFRYPVPTWLIWLWTATCLLIAMKWNTMGDLSGGSGFVWRVCGVGGDGCGDMRLRAYLKWASGDGKGLECGGHGPEPLVES